MKTLGVLRSSTCMAIAAVAPLVHADMVAATDSAAFLGTGTQDVSQSFNIRNNFYTNGGHALAYLRFTVDSTAGTIGGVAFDDITAISLDFNVQGYNSSNTGSSIFQVWALNDGLTNTDPGGLSETTWTEANFTRASAPHGTDVAVSTGDGVGLLSTAFDYSGTGVKSIPLDVTAFITFLKADTNDQISLAFLGENSSRIPTISSANNTNSLPPPSLNITAIPEPSSLVLMGVGLAGSLALRRRKG